MQLLEGIFIAHRSYVARMKTKSQKQIMRSFPGLHGKGCIGQNVKSREEPANARWCKIYEKNVLMDAQVNGMF